MNKRGASILVVDDEKEIVRVLRRSLLTEGYTVFTANSGEEALDIVAQRRPDLLLLDLLLPDISGLEVCRHLRTASDVPIIILSVKEAERDKVEALDLGADDYVAKPFSIEEVLARVRVALRHFVQPSSGAEARFHAGSLDVDFGSRRVLVEGSEVNLTPTEYNLLKVFLRYRGKTLTQQMLLKEVWGDQAHARTGSLHLYVAHLRQKIEATPGKPRLIQTIPGVGYRFNDMANT